MAKNIPNSNPATEPLAPAEVDPTNLPDNAFRELAADETYRPVMHPARDYAEVTPYSVGMGLLLAVIFSAAAAYLGLRVGQVFEAAIPIAIIAVVSASSSAALPPITVADIMPVCTGFPVVGSIMWL